MFTDITTGPILWTILNFLILLALLAKFAWKPITEAIAKREIAINDAVEQAERTRVEAEKMIADNRSVMAKSEADAQELLRESREYSDKIRADAVGRAEDEAQVLLARAKDEIERSKKEALNQLRAEVASLVVGASEKILKEKIDAETGNRLVESYLAEAAAVSSN